MGLISISRIKLTRLISLWWEGIGKFIRGFLVIRISNKKKEKDQWFISFLRLLIRTIKIYEIISKTPLIKGLKSAIPLQIKELLLEVISFKKRILSISYSFKNKFHNKLLLHKVHCHNRIIWKFLFKPRFLMKMLIGKKCQFIV